LVVEYSGCKNEDSYGKGLRRHKMLFLVQFEYGSRYLGTFLLRAANEDEANRRLEDYLLAHFPDEDGDWRVSEDGDKVQIQTLAKLQTLADLVELLPVIE